MRRMPLVFAFPLALAACQTAATKSPRADLMKPEASVAAVLNEFHAAAANAQYETYFSRWTDQSVFLGTDATERWQGSEFKDFARPYFEKGQGWTYLPRNRHISFSADGNTAWFDELLDNEKYGEARGSGVLLRKSDSWVIVQYNLSFPVPNDVAGEVTTRIRQWKKESRK